MNAWSIILLFVLIMPVAQTATGAGGITPEQIYQPTIDWKTLIGTWEVLPEGNPLEEKTRTDTKSSHRTLMTLRKDGTCRIFDKEHPTGSDGLWTFEDHEMFVTFRNGSKVGFYIYGSKGDFMITRSPIKDGKDQLWSRVK